MKKNHAVLKTACSGALLLVSTLAYSQIDITLDLATNSNTPEAAVASGFEQMCPRILELATEDAGLLQLQSICTALDSATVEQTEQAYRAMSARSNTSNTSTATYGPGAMPMPLIGKRLAALRRAAENAQNAYLDIEFNGQPIPRSQIAQLFDNQTGGGASADQVGSRLSGFFSAMSIHSEQAETQTLASYHGKSAAGVLGIDYRFTDKLFAGIAGRYAQSDIDLHGGSGSLTADDMNITLYSTYYRGKDWYLEGTAHYGHGKFDLTREINFTLPGPPPFSETAQSSTDGNQFGISLGGGTEWMHKGGAVTQVMANLYYNRSKLDAYTETGANGLNLDINEQTIDSLQSHIGAQLSKSASYSWGVIIPQINFTWVYEFLQDGENMQASFAADPTNTQFAFTSDEKDPSYFMASLGAVTVLPGGFTAYVQVERYLQVDNYEQRIWSLGARMEF